MTDYRMEKDSMGEVAVPADSLYGAQTARAVKNFPVSGFRMPRRMIRALGLIKKACATANIEIGILERQTGRAIIQAAEEVARGDHDREFVVDVFQTGSGTSTNMNANEVIANRAIQVFGGTVGTRYPVHPNDHVNHGQSSNDVFPSAIHVSVLEGLAGDLEPALVCLAKALERKAAQFDAVVKIGRTHLQDAVPIHLGQEFSAYASQIRNGIERLQSARPHLFELPLGGTAVGTGLNAPPGFADKAIERLADETGLPLRGSTNLFEAVSSRDALVQASGSIRTVSVSLAKIAGDIRWLASGPRCGIGEVRIPDLQPGSSIMPGKVNPVIPEMMLMVCAQVQGNDFAVSMGGLGGRFELNTMMPLIAHNILGSINIISRAVSFFTDRCIEGLEADEERCREMVERSLALATSLAPVLGYDTAAEIVHEALKTNRTLREICRERKVLSETELDDILNARRMTGE